MRKLITFFTQLLSLILISSSFLSPNQALGQSVQNKNANKNAGNAGKIVVLEVHGYLDPVTTDFLSKALTRANQQAAELAVLQLDSPGARVSRSQFLRLKNQFANSKVPIAVWVGGAGAQLKGASFELLRVAAAVGVATDVKLSDNSKKFTINEAQQEGIVDDVVPTLGDFIVALDGRNVKGHIVETAQVVHTANGALRQEPDRKITFLKMSLLGQLLHTVTSPVIAFLFLVLGLLLIMFEFFSAGIGISSGTGALLVLLASYGLGVLPTRWWGLGLILLAMFGFSVDIQVGTPRVWTVIGTVSFIAGMWFFYNGISLSPIFIVIVLFLTLAFVLAAIPTTVRARFSTRSLGREWMIGQDGVAVDAIQPEGSVKVLGGFWKARASRAATISAGESIKVVGIEGQTLQIEPLTRQQ